MLENRINPGFFTSLLVEHIIFGKKTQNSQDLLVLAVLLLFFEEDI